MNLDVDSEGYHFLHQGLGVDVAKTFKWKNLEISPSVYAAWIYEYFGDEAQTNANFAGGGAAFSTNGAKPAQHSLAMGAEVILLTMSNISFIANYDFEVKDEFWSHTYAGTVRYEF